MHRQKVTASSRDFIYLAEHNFIFFSFVMRSILTLKFFFLKIFQIIYSVPRFIVTCYVFALHLSTREFILERKKQPIRY